MRAIQKVGTSLHWYQLRIWRADEHFDFLFRIGHGVDRIFGSLQ